MNRSALFPALCAVALLAVATPAPAAIVHTYDSAAISPDGTMIATVETLQGENPQIVLRDRAGRVTQSLSPCRRCTYQELAFTPDGALALLAYDVEREVQSLLLVEDGKTRRLAALPGMAHDVQAAPDGRSFAFLLPQQPIWHPGACQRLPDQQRLATVARDRPLDADDKGVVTYVSPPGHYIHEYDWLPDGQGFVVSDNAGDGTALWWQARLDRLDRATGALTPIAAPAMQIRMPRVAPSGREVAFIGGLMSDYDGAGGDVWTVPLAGGAPRNLTEGARLTTTALDWTKGGLRAVQLTDDQVQVAEIMQTGRIRPMWQHKAATLRASGDRQVSFNDSGNGMAMSVEDANEAPALYAGGISTTGPVARDNAELAGHAKVTSLHWNNDGYRLQGWLLLPAKLAPGSKPPLVTILHGGPASAAVPAYYNVGLEAQMLDAGYALFMPNPRGSFGQGQAFTAANRGDFGGGDFRDIMTGIDAALKEAALDDSRLGLIGASYGGFLTMWAATQSERFAAIVSIAGVADWRQYAQDTRIRAWLPFYFGKTAEEDPEAYDAASPLRFVDRVITPTLLIASRCDEAVPPTQAQSFAQALEDRDMINKLFLYGGEGHSLLQGGNARDVNARILRWLADYMGGKRAKAQ